MQIFADVVSKCVKYPVAVNVHEPNISREPKSIYRKASISVEAPGPWLKRQRSSCGRRSIFDKAIAAAVDETGFWQGSCFTSPRMTIMTAWNIAAERPMNFRGLPFLLCKDKSSSPVSEFDK
jgi:hypothetical protein